MDEKKRSLAELGLTAIGGAEAQVTGLAVDSRKVKPGALFAALPGTKVHGAEFVPQALRSGAVAVLTDLDGARRVSGACAEAGVAVIAVEDPRAALSFASALWFGPGPETIVAVTGTNGKTSVASFCRQIWQHLGLGAVNLGTTGVEGSWETPLAHTTPEPITLHQTMANARAEGITHLAMEASSHGLAQRRLDAVPVVAAGFTNLSQDHLDYHKDFEDYFSAKAGLFDRVMSDEGIAVIYMDDDWGPRMAEVAEDREQEVIRVGHGADAHLRILDQRFEAEGQILRFQWNGTPMVTRLDLVGGFQAQNVMVAAGLVIAAGADPKDVWDALPALSGVRGRMQKAAVRANGAPVYVDYSHTPASLETALKALRPHAIGRLVVVFGAGGDRDAGKRVLMGQAAAENADVVYVTDDNPRSEDPAAIRACVLSGCPDAIEVGDRAEAILRGVDQLQPGDVLLVAGKGHETGQEVGDTIYPFDDVEQASVAVEALDGALS